MYEDGPQVAERACVKDDLIGVSLVSEQLVKVRLLLFATDTNSSVCGQDIFELLLDVRHTNWPRYTWAVSNRSATAVNV
jgi:hypothetical protein